MSEDKDQRTELPTKRRLDKARESGNIPYSREVSTAFIVGVMFFCTLFPPTSQFREIFLLMRYIISHSSEITKIELISFLLNVFKRVLFLLSFPFIVLTFIYFLSGFLQTRFIITFESLAINFKKISPIEGIKKIFSLRAFSDFLMTIVKVISVSFVIYLYAKYQKSVFMESIPNDMGVFFKYFAKMLLDLLKILFFAVLFFAIIDLILKRYFYIRSLMMTKQEIKDELKETEIRPEIKSKMRKFRSAILKSMIREVAKADVVITNPEHISIAMLYKIDEMPAPRVIAKGVGNAALNIRREALKNQIPIIENKPLAQALFRAVPVGDYIPEKYYKAVAEIISHIYKMRRGN